MPRVYSSTTLAESTISESMQIITTVLKMDAISFLGISIMGQTVEDGSGGIFVGSIMKGGAVAADGKIQPGDLLLKVNEINFENLTNEEAVKALREVVQQSGPITLTVARPEYDPIEDYNFEPRSKSTCTFYCSFTDDNVRLRIIHLILPGYVVSYVRISVEFVCIQC